MLCCVDRCFSFFVWPLCYLSFFDLLILITPLVSSNTSSSTALHIQLKKRQTTITTITLHLVVSVWEQSCKSSFNYRYAFLQISLFITWLDTKLKINATLYWYIYINKSMMSPKTWSVAVIRRRTDHVMSKRKKTKGQQWSTKYWKVIHESY